jgi:hypothetical protein
MAAAMQQLRTYCQVICCWSFECKTCPTGRKEHWHDQLPLPCTNTVTIYAMQVINGNAGDEPQLE